MVGGLLGKWSVVGWLVGRWPVDLMKPGKNMSEVVISPVQFGRGLFCYSNFIFFHIDDKEKANLIARISHLNL